MTELATISDRLNGLDLDALNLVVDAINEDPAQALVAFRVATEWTGQTRSRSTVDSWTIGGKKAARSYVIAADEPEESGRVTDRAHGGPLGHPAPARRE